MNEILYCHAEEDADTVGAGDWFFHTGQRAQCAAAGETEDGSWNLFVAFEVAGKPLAARTGVRDRGVPRQPMRRIPSGTRTTPKSQCRNGAKE